MTDYMGVASAYTFIFVQRSVSQSYLVFIISTPSISSFDNFYSFRQSKPVCVGEHADFWSAGVTGHRYRIAGEG